MGDTSIQWTDKTWNPVSGCDKVSQGCKNCYAERIWPKVYGKFRPFTQVECHKDRLEQPLKVKKPCRWFVNSMSDLFHDRVPFTFIDDVVFTMIDADWHTYQILTKRADRALEYFNWTNLNVSHKRMQWGVSVEDQKNANARVRTMRRWRDVGFRWISAEPLIGSLDLMDCGACEQGESEFDWEPKIDWLVIGGESGPREKVRKFNLRWAYDLTTQCRLAGIPAFVKQLGRSPYFSDGSEMAAKHNLNFKDSHGGDINEWPEDLRIREYPA